MRGDVYLHSCLFGMQYNILLGGAAAQFEGKYKCKKKFVFLSEVLLDHFIFQTWFPVKKV